jgi:predicted transcriptional regulator
MIRLEEKYEQALQFRKRGFTYSEIAKIVGVSKSTVSNWVAKKPFSKKVKADNQARAARDNVKRISLVNKARTAERKTRYAEAVSSAETEYKHYKKDPLFAAGLMAYISNGDMHDDSRLRLTSASFTVHQGFISFAQNYLGVKKESLHVWLILYRGLNEKKCMTLWSKKTKISIAQFYKTQFIEQEMKKGGLQHGTGNTIIGNTVLKKKLLCWIELFSKELQ